MRFEAEKWLVVISILAIPILVFFFFLGWLFPVEGPYDYLYDDYASQPAHKSPKKTAPLVNKQFIIDINDLSEEDFEALEAIFVNK